MVFAFSAASVFLSAFSDSITGLTQVLVDVTSGVTNTYEYGNGRIAQNNSGGGTNYFLGDALGNVRQLTDSNGNVTLTKSYQPYGSVLSSSGSGSSSYGFTGEWTDNTGLVYLRARYYAPGVGRFVTKDTWPGDYSRPLTLNGFSYSFSNPVNYTDPSGLMARCNISPRSLSSFSYMKQNCNGQISLLVNFQTNPWQKYIYKGGSYTKPWYASATPIYYREPPPVHVTIPVRHPLDLNKEFDFCDSYQKKLYYLNDVKFTTWEVNARNLMAEVNGVIENGQEWALRDAIGIAYSPYNRVMWNRYKGAPQDPDYEPEIPNKYLDVKNLLVSGSQYGVGHPGSIDRAWTGSNGKNSDYIYDISLIIAYGVSRHYFIDTSFGATEYHHIEELCGKNGPAFFIRDPEQRIQGKTGTKNYQYNGISSEQLWDQQGWKDGFPVPDRYPVGCK